MSKNLRSEVLFLILFLVVFSKVPEAFIKALKTPITKFNLISQPQYLLTPQYGNSEVLPQETQEILTLGKTLSLSNYTLSKQLVDNPLIMQRTMESMYPTIPIPQSQRQFFLSAEDLPAGCQPLGHLEKVQVANCN